MLTGNIGEWSEIYTLLKVVADKELHAGDKDLNQIESLIYPIVRVLRTESNGTYEYSYDNSLVLIKNGLIEYRIPISEFHRQASNLLTSLKNASGGTFSFPDTEKFINTFDCHSLKASSSVKTDIQVVIHDCRTGATPLLGFSIKSQLGGASTLLNASRATNFIYKIDNVVLSDSEIEDINSISTKSKIKDRINAIVRRLGVITFTKTENPVFGNNLMLIDSALPDILSNILCLYFTTNHTTTKELVDEITKGNPLGYDLSSKHPFYSYKFKRFLTDIALGMMPSKVWTGELDATGGYLVVKDDGEILCYHIYNRNEFEDYLLNNTKLETASSTKHNFGSIYKNDLGELLFNLNMQIRFIK
ncbi:HpaII family restriction endonuclease [Dysgonomonas sp. 520]|uniref:HpaII family restriction endonuclease n=1 Tax=Dysgonomonas sp. 520 TaxID=2302931 RepID=UPI0013D54D05|nr:HpaII family restriction endonuclease [Dysgonomonas sp. 520]NDW08230.1 HpaII family restriction endonuclease [Dysgonomonas sp. 520]